MAAVFPQAAACQENVTGPIEIPDHVLVRQTIDDTLHEALDIDGLRALLERIEAGEVRVHCGDTTEPSVLAHEILTARPYAFLDDEELQNRRTNAVHLRRGLPIDLATIGALDPEAIERVHAEITPGRRRPTTCTTCCPRASCCGRAPSGQHLWDELIAARARPGCCRRRAVDDHRSTAREARAALAGEDDAVVRAVRGHLELTGVTTVAALSASDDARRRRPGRRLWRRSSTRASRMQGRYRARRNGHRVGRAAAAGAHALLLEAVAPRRGSSRPPRRTSCASCCAGSTSRPAPS